MPIDSVKSPHRLIRIGIECESIEEDTYGVSRLVRKLLEQLSTRPELIRTHKFYLYFKKKIPDYPFLDSPLFVKRVTTPRWAPVSFNFHYHVWMIARAYLDSISVLYVPAYQLPLLWFKKSVVMLTEDIWREMRNPKVPFRYRLSYTIFSNWAARDATRVMAISETSKSEIAHLFGIAPGRIVINELAVDPATPATPMPGKYILYVGQAFERRHLVETIRAFQEIAANDPELQLIAIGPDKYQPPAIADLVRYTNNQLNRLAVRHIERVSDADLARFYAGAQAVAYISWIEAFGLPPLEALAYQVPAVVADTPLNRGIYGDHVFYVSHKDDIGRALRAALTDTSARERIRQAAPDILAHYTWSAHADRFLHIIADLTR
jgi:glycosyltransferase involved in cell wall biosynthesis